MSTPNVRVAKRPQDEGLIGPHGFVGDRHATPSEKHGRAGPNLRQWSAVSNEDVDEICASMGVPAFGLGELGENLRLSGMSLSEFDTGAVLEFPSGAQLLVVEQNDPCANAAAELAKNYGPQVGRYFVRRAFGKRGVIGTVLREGVVRVGDEVVVTAPEGVEDQAANRAEV